MKARALTARGIAALPPGKRYADGQGLWLTVRAPGRGKWCLRYVAAGKRHELGLGGYPDVSLAQARAAATAARVRLAQGQDPIAEARRPAPAAVPTFAQAAERYIEAHAAGWSNAKHREQWTSTLSAYVFPLIGSVPVDRIDTEAVLRVLTPIWNVKTETATRVRGRVEAVLDWAGAKKYRTGANPAAWRGHLSMLLARPSRVQAVIHHPAMPYTEVPGFLLELTGKPGISPQALKFLVLTACRSGEVLGAQWDEVDLGTATWTIPATRMKTRIAHRVPLTDAALALLETLPRIEGNPFVFPGVKHGRPLGNMALLETLKDMGYGPSGDRGDYTVHGFRSSFRDWCGEESSFSGDLAEQALGHVVGSKVELAYRRGTMFEKRRGLMTAWADWCLRPVGTVVQMRRAR